MPEDQLDAAAVDDTALDDTALDDAFERFNRTMGAGTVEDPYPDLAVTRREAAVAPMRFELGPGVDRAEPAEVPPIYQAFSFEAVPQVLLDGETFSSSGYARSWASSWATRSSRWTSPSTAPTGP